MGEGSAEPNVANLWATYEKAQAQFAEAVQQTTAARDKEDWARKRVNEAQKALDKFYVAAKNKAPTGSNWADEKWQQTRSKE